MYVQGPISSRTKIDKLFTSELERQSIWCLGHQTESLEYWGIYELLFCGAVEEALPQFETSQETLSREEMGLRIGDNKGASGQL